MPCRWGRRGEELESSKEKQKDGQKVAEEEKGRLSSESDESDDSDADPRHKPSESAKERPESVKD